MPFTGVCVYVMLSMLICSSVSMGISMLSAIIIVCQSALTSVCQSINLSVCQSLSICQAVAARVALPAGPRSYLRPEDDRLHGGEGRLAAGARGLR